MPGITCGAHVCPGFAFLARMFLRVWGHAESELAPLIQNARENTGESTRVVIRLSRVARTDWRE